MATIKAFSDLEQSKKLAEILPIESADMHYNDWNYEFCVGYKHTGEYIAGLGVPTTICGELEIPCWSLAALLSVIPKTINFGYENDSTFVLKPLTNGKYLADYYEISYVKDNPVDACYEMIIKLNELNLL